MNLWQTILIHPLAAALLFLYQNLGQNLGLAIIVLTILLRLILLPLTLPATRMLQIQQEIRPELEGIKKKYAGNQQMVASKQLELLRARGINPLAGCLPQILQIVLLIALYQVFFATLKDGGLSHQFLFWDLSVRDPYFILPVLAALSQFFLSKLMLPPVSAEHAVVHEKGPKEADFATALQKQNLYLFPALTLLLGFQFPAGLMLYWFVTTLLQIPQQMVFARRKR